jgi:hypothetical protein
MGEMLREIGLPAIEGMLALTAALSAVAFRRRTRMFTPAGFIMLALGLMLDLLAPYGMRAPEWTRYLRALAVVLLWFGIIRLGVESVEAWIQRRRAHVSTIATELILTALYAAVVLIVTWTILSFDIRRLLAIPALFALVRAWLQQRDLFSGLLLQSQRPFRPRDRMARHADSDARRRDRDDSERRTREGRVEKLLSSWARRRRGIHRA